MKNTLKSNSFLSILLIFLFIFSGISFGQFQWRFQSNKLPLKAIHFTSPTNGFILNDSYKYVTTNGGNKFNMGNVNSNSTYGDRLVFINSTTGFMVFTSGSKWYSNSTPMLKKTTNGGQTWTNISFTGSFAVEDVFFLNNLTGFAVGTKTGVTYQGVLLKTTNGGLNWITINNTFSSGGFNRIAMFNETNGIVLAKPQTYYVTHDGWNTVTSFSPVSSLIELSSVHIYNNMAYILGNPSYTLRTTNGGYNWTGHSSNFGNIRNGYFYNSDNGYVGDYYGYIYRTTNGGINWFSTGKYSGSYINNFYFLDVNNGLAIAQDGEILRTTNGGSNWIIINSFLPGNLTSIAMADNNKGLILNSSGTIYRTYNGFDNWELNFNGATTIQTLCNLDSTKFIAAGNAGIIYTSTNLGNNWSSQTHSNTNFTSGYFLNSQTGWLAGNGKIIKTINGGNSWINQFENATVGLYHINFKSADTGYAMGRDKNLLITTNGGNNWTLSTHHLFNYYSIDWATPQIGFLVVNYFVWQPPSTAITNRILLKTEDSGLTWTEKYRTITVPVPFFTSVASDNANNIVLVSLNGEIIASYDQGANFYLASSVQDFAYNNVYFKSPNTGWILGNNSLLLTTKEQSVSIREHNKEIPSNYSLYQNYPNPFNPTTNIPFELKEPSHVTLKVFDARGREVERTRQRSLGHRKVHRRFRRLRHSPQESTSIR